MYDDDDDDDEDDDDDASINLYWAASCLSPATVRSAITWENDNGDDDKDNDDEVFFLNLWTQFPKGLGFGLIFWFVLPYFCNNKKLVSMFCLIIIISDEANHLLLTASSPSLLSFTGVAAIWKDDISWWL